MKDYKNVIKRPLITEKLTGQRETPYQPAVSRTSWCRA